MNLSSNRSTFLKITGEGIIQKIIPHLWFDREAVEAAQFYTKTFKDTFIKSKTKLGGTPSGEVDHLWNELHESGKELMPLAKYPFSER